MYVGDTGGRLWRFDISTATIARIFGEGGVLASLGAADLTDPAASDVRRFYASPDVVLVNCTRGTFLAMNIGSGLPRASAGHQIADAFFSVRDANVYRPVLTADYPAIPIRAVDLLDITDDPAAVVPRRCARLAAADDRGARARRSSAAAVTFNNTVFFTSFSPGASVNACVGGLGVNRAYAVDACNGRPVYNLDAQRRDRAARRRRPVPEPEPDRHRPGADASCSSADGTKDASGLVCFDLTGGGAFRRTFWMQEPAR